MKDELITGIWIGPTGYNPEIGYPEHGKEIKLFEALFSKFEKKKLVKRIESKKKKLEDK